MNGYIQALNEVDEEHLVEVMAVAAEIGNVEVNVYFTGEEYYALEGSHRLEAAKRLALPLVLNQLAWEDEFESDVDGLEGTIAVGEFVDAINWARLSGKTYTSIDFVSVEVK